MGGDSWRRVVDGASVGLAEVDTHGVIMYANARLLAMSGRTELAGFALRDLVHEADRRALDEPHPVDVRIGERWVSVEVTDEGIASFTDVTDRKAFERSLSDVVDLFDTFMDASPVVSWMKNAAGAYVYVNHALAASFGTTRDQMIGKTTRELLGAEGAAATQAADARVLATGLPDVDVIEANGASWQIVRFLFLDVHGTRNIAGIGVDITAQRSAETSLALIEEQLRHAQKMEAVGRLAGGIAHDFNNILTVILSYAAVLMRGRGLGDRAQADVAQIIAASERASALTRQLLSFSRREVLEPEVLDVNTVVEDTRQLLHRLLGEDIEMRVQLSRSLGRVYADAGGLGQVIMNLAVNARDAMPDGGVLTITTENVMFDELTARELRVPSGLYVRITVSDTGTGIDPTTRARIFEPFFTTKGVGEGTGLGLSTALGIVQQTGGSLTVESTAGAGATFRIDLPWTERVAVGTQPPPNVRAHGGSETVLLVEDDLAVRELTTTILEAGGYRVLSAATPAEALAIVGNVLVNEIDLVLSDVVMPGMSGVDMWTKLRDLRPDIRVLWISGYTEDSVRRHGLDSTGPFFLRKPFTPDVLTARVRAALDA